MAQMETRAESGTRPEGEVEAGGRWVQCQYGGEEVCAERAKDMAGPGLGTVASVEVQHEQVKGHDASAVFTSHATGLWGGPGDGAVGVWVWGSGESLVMAVWEECHVVRVL